MTTFTETKNAKTQPARGVNVERLLQINIAVLAALATLVLGFAQSDLKLPVMALAAAVGSVIFTDALGWFRLNRFVANVFAVLAAVFSLIAFNKNDGQQLIAIANLLVYLQVILLFQKKDVRIYWQLFVVGLLQVVVAAALNLNLAAGALMVAYMAVGVSALMLFYVYRECGRFAGTAIDSNAAGDQTARMSKAAQRRQKKAGLIASPIVTRRVLMGQLITRRLAVQISAISIGTLILTVFLFFATPRHGRDPWLGPPGMAVSTSGFSNQVNLNRSARIQLSDKEVMRVQFKDLQTGKPYLFDGEPYLQGAVLSNYYGGVWRARSGWAVDLRPLPLNEQGLVRQDTVVETGGDKVVFAVAPVFRVADSPVALMYNSNSQELLYIGQNDEQRRFEFRIATSAFRDGRLAPARPAKYSARDDGSFLGNDEFRQIADEILIESGITKDAWGKPENIAAAARAIEEHFARSGLYRYTLDMSNITRSGDPVVDFVTRNRAGHCEFFASAMALMLRSQEISSRVVVGYKGGIYNPVGKYYQVRERDSHAWVEAYIPSDQVTQDMLGSGQSIERGAWLRLDPTPAANAEPETSNLGHFVDYVENLWDDYVKGFDQRRQSESLLGADGFSYAGWSRMPKVDWGLALLLITLGLLVVAGYRITTSQGGAKARALLRHVAYRLARVISPKLAARIAPRVEQSPRNTPHVVFYQQFLETMSQYGIVRVSHQTQREFSNTAMRFLIDRNVAGDVISIPEKVIEAYYRVRFGEQKLNDSEFGSVQEALKRLELALANDSASANALHAMVE